MTGRVRDETLKRRVDLIELGSGGPLFVTQGQLDACQYFTPAIFIHTPGIVDPAGTPVSDNDIGGVAGDLMVPFQMVAGFTEASNGAAAISIAAPSAIIPAGCFFQMVMASVRDTTDNLIIPCRVQLESRNPNSPGLKVYWASVAAKDYQVEAYGYIHRIA